MINTVISHYRIIKKLGEGGMGQVFLAEDTELHRKTAMKFLPEKFTSDPDFKARFKREARAAAALNHPNIITIYDIGEFENASYIVMEYVEGESLQELMAKRRPEVGEVIDLMLQVCAGLAKAHRAGIVHRDIKPANILIDRDAQVKIVDFGLAKLAGGTKLTREGMMMGTPHYMSPEQVRGDDLDQRSDIFSVGVVLYELLTAQLPFTGENQLTVLYAIINDTPPPLTQHKADLSPKLQQLIDKALDKNPATRYQQMEEFAADLRKARPAAPTMQRTMTYVTEKPKKLKPKPAPSVAKRSPRRMAFFSAAALALVILTWLLLPGLRELFSGGGEVAPNTSLSIMTAPAGAEVFLDDVSVGETPLNNFTPPKIGTMALRLQKQNYLPIDTNVVIAGGRETKLSFPLHLAAMVTISVDPTHAEVAVDGKTLDAAALRTGLPLPSGVHNIRIWAEDYQTVQESFTVVEGRNPTRTYSLRKISVSAEPSSEPTTGGITITSLPSRASVYLNDQLVGTTPYRRENVSPDTYQLVVRQEGYEDYAKRITVSAGRTTTESAMLVASGGGLNIKSTPEGATILLNGRNIGKTPYESGGLRAGDYTVVLQKAGHKDYSTSVTVRQGQISEVNGRLSAASGKLSILVLPFGSIYIDDKLEKKDSNVRYTKDFPAGPHRVKAVNPGLGTYEKTVTVDPEKETEVVIDFNKHARLSVTSFDESGRALWANIFVDGKATNEVTPKQLTLPIGLHKIELRRTGYEVLEGEKSINLENDLDEPIRFTLRRR